MLHAPNGARQAPRLPDELDGRHLPAAIPDIQVTSIGARLESAQPDEGLRTQDSGLSRIRPFCRVSTDVTSPDSTPDRRRHRRRMPSRAGGRRGRALETSPGKGRRVSASSGRDAHTPRVPRGGVRHRPLEMHPARRRPRAARTAPSTVQRVAATVAPAPPPPGLAALRHHSAVGPTRSRGRHGQVPRPAAS